MQLDLTNLPSDPELLQRLVSRQNRSAHIL